MMQNDARYPSSAHHAGKGGVSVFRRDSSVMRAVARFAFPARCLGKERCRESDGTLQVAVRRAPILDDSNKADA